MSAETSTEILDSGDDSYSYAVTAKHLSESSIKNIDATFENWKPRKKYTLEVV